MALQTHDWISSQVDLCKSKNTFPKKLYRFRTIRQSNDNYKNFIVDREIALGEVFLAQFGQLNDPAEGNFILSFGDIERATEYFARILTPESWRQSVPPNPQLKKIILAEARARATQVIYEYGNYVSNVIQDMRFFTREFIRSASFCEMPDNQMMWAHYGKMINHIGDEIPGGGICLEYEVDQTWSRANLDKVIYSDSTPVFEICNRQHNEQHWLQQAIYRKNTAWQGEAEWRISSVFPMKADQNRAVNRTTQGSIVHINNAPSRIIFGHKMPGDFKEKIATEIREKKRDARIAEAKLQMSNGTIQIIDLE
ncbi:DUF2971 domain-containing protein [Derxia gummosa]|uniref:DUF2971 domain-containing protein n=1 Tax=Derxia gummosa DSM 723 TaxID=1121388 RepID=A0A8B6XC39_9BURK|nr:DUF2971 domain-containing protein [Derxia gummosa]